jgi:gliding motility-associated-like protein
MKGTRSTIQLHLIFFFVFFFQWSFAQLSSFSLVVTKTDETCTGNGSLSFTVQNTTPGATIIYTIYNLPNVTTPIATLSTNSFTGLSAGNYRVIATQTLGNFSNMQLLDIQIFDVRNNIIFQLSSQQLTCNTGTITATVLSGQPVTYEIVSGPVMFPPQATNSFTNLGPGSYNVRVIDACGDGYVQTFTLNFVNPPNLTLEPSAIVCGALASCSTITTVLLITSDEDTTIRYPLTIQSTTFPPNGGIPIILNQIVSTGDSISQNLTVVVPFYNNQAYSYNLTVTDACGNVYTSIGNQINEQYIAFSQQIFTNCVSGIEVKVCNFLPPYSIHFISAPAGFNPITFNGGHSGPFFAGVTFYLSTNTVEIPTGNYVIEVTDACGRISQTQVTIQDISPGFELLPNQDSCSDFTNVKIPNGGPNVTSVVIISAPAGFGNPLPYDVSFNINNGVFIMGFLPGTYVFEGVDVCGRTFTYTVVIPPISRILTETIINTGGCTLSNGGILLNMTGAVMASILITQAPVALNQIVPFDVSSSILLPQGTSAQINNLPAGNYILDVMDTCGNHYIKDLVCNSLVSTDPLILQDKKGCGEGFDSISLVSPNLVLQTVIITAAPTSFPFPLPYNVSFNIAFNGIFYMNSLPEGAYTFYTKDACNIERTETFQLIGNHPIADEINVIANCGSFNLSMNYSDNAFATHNYWLQKFNPITNQWEHPITGVPFVANSILTATNSYSLVNMATNFNIVSFGSFRVLTEYNYYSNGSIVLATCIDSIKTFDFNGSLEIVSAYTIPCATQGSQVFIIANGIAPLDYKITAKNGQPFQVNNGTSNVFSGLLPGIYNFRVQDICGNIVNRLFDITTLPEPSIAATNLCEGQTGQLSVQFFPFFNYQWWKGTNTSTILSTTNVLTFNPFLTASAAGTYYVRIYSSNLTTCVDRIISFTIPFTSNPNAGLDGNLTICGSISTVNLFSILSGTYDAGGVWEEITSSGMLSGNNWLPVGISYGTYTFKYTVTGFCSSMDQSLVTINFNPIPAIPNITTTPNYCSSDDIQLMVQTIPNATYQWSGPGGFSSSIQNPIIANSTINNSGTYIVKAMVNGCDASASITINVKPNPILNLESSCVNGAYTLLVSPLQNSFATDAVSYSWTGPNGFSSVNNPIVITNFTKGIYSVTVTTTDGCSTMNTINIATTLCTIPNGISPNGDGSNESFDLSGFDDVQNLKIFNRYGMVVYEQDNYVNQWHGQQKNNDSLLPSATYYYLVSFKKKKKKTGWVYLTR